MAGTLFKLILMHSHRDKLCSSYIRFGSDLDPQFGSDLDQIWFRFGSDLDPRSGSKDPILIEVGLDSLADFEHFFL